MKIVEVWTAAYTSESRLMLEALASVESWCQFLQATRMVESRTSFGSRPD